MYCEFFFFIYYQKKTGKTHMQNIRDKRTRPQFDLNLVSFFYNMHVKSCKKVKDTKFKSNSSRKIQVEFRIIFYMHLLSEEREQTSNVWISRSISFPDQSFEWRGLRLLTRKLVWKFGDSRENVFDMYGDSRENCLKFSAVVIVSSPISSLRGTKRKRGKRTRNTQWMSGLGSDWTSIFVQVHHIYILQIFFKSFTFITSGNGKNTHAIQNGWAD